MLLLVPGRRGGITLGPAGRWRKPLLGVGVPQEQGRHVPAVPRVAAV